MPVAAVARRAALEVKLRSDVDRLPGNLRELAQKSVQRLGLGRLSRDRLGTELEAHHFAVANQLGELLVREGIEPFVAAQVGRRVAKPRRVGAVADTVGAVTTGALSHVERAAFVDHCLARQWRAEA